MADSVSAEEKKREEKKREEALFAVLLALTRATHDPIRPKVREEGLEERDLAFEAQLLTPAEVEMSVYATQKRNRVLRLLRDMRDRGWIQMEPKPPTGAYYVSLKDSGLLYVQERMRPPWSKLWGRVRSRLGRA